jgi:hypothetical protein
VACSGTVAIPHRSGNSVSGSFSVDGPPMGRPKCRADKRADFCELDGLSRLCGALSGAITDGEVAGCAEGLSFSVRFGLGRQANGVSTFDTMTGCRPTAAPQLLGGIYYRGSYFEVAVKQEVDCPGDPRIGKADLRLSFDSPLTLGR